MSHTFQTDFLAYAPVILTIHNYVNGGESVPIPALNGMTVNVLMGIVPPWKNSLGVTLYPLQFPNAIIRLFQFQAGTFSEIPTTNNLNAEIIGWILAS